MDPQIHLPGRLYSGFVGDVSEAERHRLIVSDVETLRYHYAFTLEEWYRRTVAARTRLSRCTTSASIACGNSTWPVPSGIPLWRASNFQVQFLKSRQSAPITRDYMFEEEARLRGLEEPPKWHLDVAAE